MNGAVQIRPITADDSLENLTDLLHAAFAELAAMGLNYTAVDQSIEVTAQRVKNATCFVAVAEGRLVGTITVERPVNDPICPYFGQPHVASVHQLGVSPSHQRKGIGSRLMQQAEGWALANGYSEMVLDTAEPAHHLRVLYERMEYEHVGFVQWEGKRYRSVLMAKKLGHAV